MATRGLMDAEELEGARRNRERIGVVYPDVREETDESKLKGREQDKIRKEEIKQAMAKKEKTQKVQEMERKATTKVKTPDQSADAMPVAPEGKKAIWHKPYSYTNKAGTTISIRGHWEMANLPKEKPKAEVKAEPVAEAEAEEVEVEEAEAEEE